MTYQQANNCLVRIARRAMGTYANRWRVARNDPNEREYAVQMLREAIRLRELARQYEQTMP